jgi:ABC-type glycerol-3-phosphate transport system substrate-binding protein
MAKASGQGQVFGIAQNFEDLYWSMSGFQAGNALVSSLRGEPPTAQQTQQLVRWLSWLRDASYQQNVLFLRDQATLRKQLIRGQLNWISCWSSQLPQLREALKDNLGVTSLPAGALGPATPISKLQVWALGRNSSARQRHTAEELMQFIVQPWAQKTWSLRYRTNYPVNPAAATIINRQIPGIENLYLFKAKQELRIGDEIVAAIDSNPRLAKAIQHIVNDVIFGSKTPVKAAERLTTLFSQSS